MWRSATVSLRLEINTPPEAEIAGRIFADGGGLTMAKRVEHIHWPDAPDIWMPYAPACSESALASCLDLPAFRPQPAMMAHRDQPAGGGVGAGTASASALFSVGRVFSSQSAATPATSRQPGSATTQWAWFSISTYSAP